MSEKQAIKLARRGKRAAQAELFESYKNLWFSICLRYMKTRADSEDVLQDALIQIFGKLKSFDPQKGSFKSWSSKVVVNAVLMNLRSKNRSFEQEDLADQHDLADEQDSPMDLLTAKELTELIAKLPVGYQVVFNMYAVDGYSHKEIAQELGISEGTSKSQLFKARKLLRQKLEVLI